MSLPKKITIIGAGAVGANAALMLQKQGYEVTLLEADADVLEGGASVTCNINHADGFEYHKQGHKKTGEGCIEGAICKSLMYPREMYETRVCNTKNPIRFLVSGDSLNVDGLTAQSFYDNAEHMRGHFRKLFEHISTERGAKAAENLLGRNPDNFARRLTQDDYKECANIVAGYAGSGRGINMPNYYALLKAGLRKGHESEFPVEEKFNRHVTSIKKQKSGEYLICTREGDEIESDHIILAAGHNVPKLCGMIEGAELKSRNANPSAEGTYYLNAMVYVKLPATKDKEKIQQVSHINFTLQQEGGCMFACIVPPTATQAGVGAIYYPSEKGNQLAKHTYNAHNPTLLPAEWDKIIKNGMPNNDPRVRAIVQQACRYYPFLKGYAEPSKVLCRTVFNAAVNDSDKGLERRVRGIIPADVITSDGNVVAYRSPKWTNAELVALMAVDHARQALGDKPLPKHAGKGFGPTALDVEKITADLHFRNLKPDRKDALAYAERHGLPTSAYERISAPHYKSK